MCFSVGWDLCVRTRSTQLLNSWPPPWSGSEGWAAPSHLGLTPASTLHSLDHTEDAMRKTCWQTIIPLCSSRTQIQTAGTSYPHVMLQRSGLQLVFSGVQLKESPYSKVQNITIITYVCSQQLTLKWKKVKLNLFTYFSKYSFKLHVIICW